MTRRSLFGRLSILAGILIVSALALAGGGLTFLFERELERRAVYDLSQHLRTIAAQTRIDGQQPVLDAAPADPRFAEPYGGLYWQIDAPPGGRLRSRSLWDFSLTAPVPATTGEPWVGTLAGPNGTTLLAVSRRLVVPSPGGETDVAVTLALDRGDLIAARGDFLRLLAPSLLLLAALLTAAIAFFLHSALHPFRTLGAGLRAIHAGRTRTLPGRFPDEVQPVVDDLNRLIAFQDAAVKRARTQAGDLAHGLKTPLAVLGAVARDAAGGGFKKLASDIDEQVRAMSLHVSRALARARAGLVGRLAYQPTSVRAVATKAVNALGRLSGARELTWEAQIDGDPQFRGDAGDLTEMLGNLLDNAGKWAATQVRLTAAARDGELRVAVEDDGPGMPDAEMGRIERGLRWDESSPGSGFGLAITRDLVEAYGGRLVLKRSSLGGLEVSLVFADGDPATTGADPDQVRRPRRDT
jgi:signal transduction histidine kinase